MRKISNAICAVLFLCFAVAAYAERPGYFSLSTARTYSPDEKPKLHLYSRNEDTLEFRVYRVEDPEKFFTGLPDLHRFSTQTPVGPAERIDEETWLEKFHDWKHALWWRVRHFFRDQLSFQTRDALREKQSQMGRRSRVLSEAQFAQIPVLNNRQLVSRWRLQVPPTFVSDSQDLPIDPLSAGVYLIEATDGHLKAYTVLIISKMAMLTRPKGGQMLAYCVDRKSGAPIADVNVLLWSKKQGESNATAGADGLAKLAYAAPEEGGDEGSYLVLAHRGADVAAVTPWTYAMRDESGARLLKYIYTDRPVYRPGHTVHWKAILREKQADHLSVPAGRAMHVRIQSPESQKVIFDKDMTLSSMGSVNGEVTLADNAPLGYYTISVGSQDSGLDGSFYVEEYKKPEYKVTVSLDKDRVLQGDAFRATIEAKYFFGEPVANAKVKYAIYHTPHYWWSEPDEGADTNAASPDAEGDSADSDQYFSGEQEREQDGVLDANGRLTITVKTRFDAAHHDDLDYRIEARVTDAAKREISGVKYGLATYGSYRVQIEPASWVYQPDQTPEIKVHALDYDQKPIQTQVHLAAFRHTYKNYKGSEEHLSGDVDATTDATGIATVKMPLSQRGSIEVRATAETPEHRTVRSSTWLYLVGDNGPDSARQDQTARILTDKKVYKPGDVAHLSLLSDVDDPWVLVTTSGGSLQSARVIQAHGRTLTFDVPITAQAQPNLSVRAVFLRENQVYQAQKDLKVPPTKQKLTVEITPAAETFQPQAKADYDVLIKDASGNPVAAEFSFGVVDEALYQVRPDRSGDIVNAFYPQNSDYTEFSSSLEYYFSGEAGIKSPLLAELRARTYNPRLAQVKPANDLVQPKVRKAFPDTAFWGATFHTDAAGHARVTMQFPDSLTTWRTTVRAITMDTRGGSAIQRVIVRKNIIVRLAAPRFFRQGDEVVLPVIVHNYLTAAKTVHVLLDATGVEMVSGSAQDITVPSRGEATAQWRVRANKIGNAVFTAKALTNEESDAIEITLPIEPFGVKQTLAASGGIDNGQTEATTTITFPAGTDAASHTLAISVAPSVAGSLFGALDYLTTYPYGCTEQTMSSFLPNIIVANALKSLNLKARVDPAELKKKVDAGSQRLYDYQHDDGGWGWWKEDTSRVFMTAYVVGGFAQARQTGFDVQQESMDRGIAYLHKQLAQHPNMIPDLRAYVVYALTLAGERSARNLDDVWNRRADLSPEGVAITGLALLQSNDSRAKDAAQMLEARVQHEGSNAYWPSNFDYLLDFSSDNSAEATAYALRLLTVEDPSSPLLAQAASWLVLHRSEGYWWASTKQTAMVLYGLVDYLAHTQELKPDFDADVLLNGRSVATKHFGAQDAVGGSELSVTIKSADLQPEANNITLHQHGVGRLYWTAQSTYFTTQKSTYQKGTLALNLTRDYYKLTKSEEKGRVVYKLDPLNGPVASGDLLAVHLALSGNKFNYILLEDPIPSGTEFVDNESVYEIQGRPSTWRYWYTRREFHDDRVAIFDTEFDGKNESFYLLKVVNPGVFQVSPARAEPMYQPGVQTTSDPLRLEVRP